MKYQTLLILVLVAAALTGGQCEGEVTHDCKDSCEACSNVEVDSVFLEGEFMACNVCGGVKFKVECDVTDSATADRESVAVEVAAGEFENIARIYYVTADCSRNILLTKRYAKGKKKKVELDLVLDTQRVSVENGAQLSAVVEKETKSDPRDPLAPGAQPKGHETLACTVS
ncbi:hypothetical protein BSKO_07896 [Bryopsis sp. KO-2023]|nr:hypothetical protein BSKO_07896 [Bryopsis sp. KO-2023]